MTVEIKQEDIDKAIKETGPKSICTHCILAQALMRMGFTNVYISPSYTEFYDGTKTREFTNPYHITSLDMEDFHTVKPQTIVLESVW